MCHGKGELEMNLIEPYRFQRLQWFQTDLVWRVCRGPSHVGGALGLRRGEDHRDRDQTHRCIDYPHHEEHARHIIQHFSTNKER